MQFTDLNIFPPRYRTCVLFGAQNLTVQTCFLDPHNIFTNFFQISNKLTETDQLIMAEVSAEVYRTNKLLEIENLDWENQLKRAVGGFQSRP